MSGKEPVSKLADELDVAAANDFFNLGIGEQPGHVAAGTFVLPGIRPARP